MSQAGSRVLHIEGNAGRLAILADSPAGPAKGVAVIAHPQPLMGGSPRHKVPHHLARAVCGIGFEVLRPSFRGVGSSEGQYDNGIGETEDMLNVVQFVRHLHPGLPLALIGFSFGAYVMSRVVSRLAEAGQPADITALLALPVGDTSEGRYYDTKPVPRDTLIVHGENDSNARLAALLDWARPVRHPIVVMPGSDHFFSGSLDTVVSIVLKELRLCLGRSDIGCTTARKMINHD